MMFALRVLAVIVVTLPWLTRSWFPVHSFSDNYKKIDKKSTPLIRFLYHVKKYQYVFYKHFLLHGLNISVALMPFFSSSTDLKKEKFSSTNNYFRLYWLLLNTSYTMEFFLQTLVKRHYIQQKVMLRLQKVLMTAATLAALFVLQYVHIGVCVASLILNFTNRKHDLLNTCLSMIIFTLMKIYNSQL